MHRALPEGGQPEGLGTVRAVPVRASGARFLTAQGQRYTCEAQMCFPSPTLPLSLLLCVLTKPELSRLTSILSVVV